MEVECWKRETAEAAVELVQSGMVLGLGHGSTVRYAILKIAELLRPGKRLLPKLGTLSVTTSMRQPRLLPLV